MPYKQRGADPAHTLASFIQEKAFNNKGLGALFVG